MVCMCEKKKKNEKSEQRQNDNERMNRCKLRQKSRFVFESCVPCDFPVRILFILK